MPNKEIIIKILVLKHYNIKNIMVVTKKAQKSSFRICKFMERCRIMKTTKEKKYTWLYYGATKEEK